MTDRSATRARGRKEALSRRALLAGMAGGLGALALCGARSVRAAGPLVAARVRPELAVLGGAGGNVVVLATDAGQVLVDGGAAGFRDAVLQALADLPGGPVTALFNTHWHRDQIGANEALGAAGAAIYAHAKTRQRLTRGYYVPEDDRYESPLAPAGRPTHSFHDGGDVTIGGRRIEYGYLLEAHTDGDIYVFFPEQNVVAAGDAIAPAGDPELDWFGGGWLGGRIDALARLLELGDRDTRFVPGRGPVVGRAEVEAELAMSLELFDRMVEHVRLGETAADMLEAGVLDGLGREFADPAKLLYDLHKGFWAHHNTLSHDIV